MENIFVSYFPSQNKGESNHVINLRTWLLEPNSFTEIITYLRCEENEGIRRKLKNSLPAVTPSGIFVKRKADLIKKYTGIICIDIDGKDNLEIVEFEALKMRLMDSILGDYILYCGLSSGGKGIFCLIRVAYPERHKEHFYALAQDFASLGIVIDRSCSDICRLRFYSWDEKPCVNMGAKEYTKCIERETARIVQSGTANKKNRVVEFVETKLVDNRSPRERLLDSELYDDCRIITISNRDRIKQLVETICAECIDITVNYGDWFAIGCILARLFEEEGRELFHAIGQFYPDYKREESDNEYSKCMKYGRGYYYKTEKIFDIARKYGLDF